MTDNNRKFLNIIISIMLVIAAGAVGVAAFVAQHYKGIIKEKLPGWVSKSTDSVYSVSFQDISINIFTRKITIDNLKLWYDTAQIRKLNDRQLASKTYFAFNIPEVVIENIAWEELIGEKNLSCGELLINHPSISVMHAPWLNDSLKVKTTNHQSIEELHADLINIAGANVIYKELKSESKATYQITGGNILLHDWDYKPKSPPDTTRFLFAKTSTVSFQTLTINKPGDLYKVTLGKINFLSAQDSLQINDIKIEPAYSEAEFHKKMGHQSDMFHASFPSVFVSGFDWKKAINNGSIIAADITLKNAVVTDFFSRMVAPNTESLVGKFPNQLIQKLPIPLYVSTIRLVNNTIKYTELSNISKIPAALSFNAVSGTANNVTNIPRYLEKDKNCIIKIHGKFMGRSPMAATFNLSMTDKAGGFSVVSYMNNLEADEVSAQTEALSLVGIPSLHASKLELEIHGNEKYAAGVIKVRYTDLKLKLKKMTDDSTQMSNKTVTSFFANHIFILPSNPTPGEPLRVADTYIPRNPTQSFFNLIWKNVLQGIQKTIAKNDTAYDIMEKNAAKTAAGSQDKDKPKKGFFKRLFGKKDKDNKTDSK